MTDDLRPTAAPSPRPNLTTASSVRRLPELTRATMWITALVIAVLTAVAVVALWWPATAGLTGADLVKARLDALKVGLSIGVGSGGVVALYLAWRRQHSTEADLDNRERALVHQYEVLAHQQDVAAITQVHQEQVAADARADAAARRITDLYLKAAELLGSDKAPVRLSGLYALERLAQDNESQRQTIVNVFCAYLRMPYQPPTRPIDDADAEQFEQHSTRIQEREVRLTAQRLLTDHLKPDRAGAYWGPVDLDLTGALLVDFTLTGARPGAATFNETTFTGKTVFDEVTFYGPATFDASLFAGEVAFMNSHFNKRPSFVRVNFADIASFRLVKFDATASFDNAIFSESAKFDASTFAHPVSFGNASFMESASFNSVTFTGDAWFDQTTFEDTPMFVRATLNGRPFLGPKVNPLDTP